MTDDKSDKITLSSTTVVIDGIATTTVIYSMARRCRFEDLPERLQVFLTTDEFPPDDADTVIDI